MDETDMDVLVAGPRRSKGVAGGVAGGQHVAYPAQGSEGGSGGGRKSGGSGLVDRIVGLQRRQAGGARAVRSAKDRDADRSAAAVPTTSSTSQSETRHRSSAATTTTTTTTAQAPQRRSNNARALFDPSMADKQMRSMRDAPLGHSELPPPRGNERTRSPAMRYAHDNAAAPPRSPLRTQTQRCGRARRGGNGDDDDEDDFVRVDNKYLVKAGGGAGGGEEEDPREKRYPDAQRGYEDRRIDEYSRTQTSHVGVNEPKHTRFRDSDDDEEYGSEGQDDRGQHTRDRRRPRATPMEAQPSSKYAPITANERTSSGEGLHSWGRRQLGDEHDGTRGHASGAHGDGTGGRYQGQGPMRMLFNPNVHDPLKFQQAPSVSTGSGSNATGHTLSTSRNDYPYRNGGSSSIGTTISAESHADKSRSGKHPPSRLTIPMILDEDDEEEQKRGDRERERRKRKEGSERGPYAKKRGEEDGKSKGSRSSEGSESLRDRERGRGNDTGIIPRLREAYKGIMAMENNLTELHRKLASDPSGGVRSLIQAGLLGRGSAAVHGGSSQVFDPGMRNGAVGVLSGGNHNHYGNEHHNGGQDDFDDDDEYSRKPIRKATSSALEPTNAAQEDAGWVELITRHKKFADAIHDFLALSLDPLIPASLHTLPVKYNIPTRLWQTGFHLILEKMRYTWIANAPLVNTTRLNPHQQGPTLTPRNAQLSSQVLEHLTDFIYDAYTFYTNLLEEQTLSNFRAAWIEALGDLARYRMAVAAHVASQEPPAAAQIAPELARIDDDNESPFPSGASIGAEVAQNWHIEERETWRTTSRDWYYMGLTEKPGEGRLHHHLALLCRDVKGEEGRALYHFMKSLTTSHPYSSSRESILPLFDTALQRKRATFDATAPDLFLLMHGMLFTKIELDNFDGAFDRFMERLSEDLHMGTVSGTTRPIPQVEWLTMAIVNIAAMMQYGIDDGLLRKALAEETATRKVQKAAQASQAPHALIVRDEDASPDDHDADALAGKIKTLRMDTSHGDGLPSPLANACRLSFAMLRFCLQHPVRLIGLTNVLNPYISTMLTFLATAVKQPAALQVLEYFIPWTELVAFYNAIPQKMEIRPDPSAKLMGGPPIPEDWCIRGMEWVGRRVYERGFWKVKGNSTGSSRGSGGPAQPRQGPRVQNEMDVLTEHDTSPEDAINGVVDDVEGSDVTDTPPAITQRRWKRAAWAAGIFIGCVPGLQMSSTGRIEIVPDGPVQGKISAWEAERQRKVRQEMERSRREEEARGEWALEEGLAMSDDAAESGSEEDGDEPELADLRARRRHLRSLLRQPVPAIYSPRSARAPSRKSQLAQSPFLPGYTVLVFDTNVLLSSLELFESVTESKLWTCVVPLPVVTELDGLAKDPSPLGQAASSAIAYLESHVRSHALSLKIQTSKGNYLSDLFVRTEHIDFRENITLSNTGSVDKTIVRAQTMDDFILRVASNQSEHFVDRSRLLSMSGSPLKVDALYEEQKRTAAKVLLLTFDRNLRLRARARGIDAADEKEMAKILGRRNGTG